MNRNDQILRQHRQLDRFIDHWLTDYKALGKAIYCQSGCAGCCFLAVHAAFPEAAAIAGQLAPEQTIRLSAYVTRLKQALPATGDLKNYLKSHRQTVGPCAFLDEQNNCSIYPMRPLACRALLSTRPAEWCSVDFSELDKWDKLAYESGLDREVVAWPTHFVSATQDFAQQLEDRLLGTMRREKGWTLSGNLGVMVWLEQKYRLEQRGIITSRQVREILAAEGFDHEFLLRLSA